jgi:hypothetical protein
MGGKIDKFGTINQGYKNWPEAIARQMCKYGPVS